MPYEVKFENGQTVTFATQPTQRDIDEVAQKLQVTKQTKQPGILKSLVQGALKPFGEVGTSAVNVGESLYQMAKGKPQLAAQALEKTRNVPFLGETEPAFTGKETFGEELKKVGGYGAEIGSWFIGGGGLGKVAKQTLKGQALKGIVTGGATGLTQGALAGAGRAGQENRTLGEIATSGVVGGAIGAPLGAVAGGLAPVVAKGAKTFFEPIEKQVSSKIRMAIDKGLKPSLKSVKQGESFYKKAEDAFQIISERKPAISVEGELDKIYKAPENRMQMLEALNESKKQIYNEYTDLAEQAEGVGYNPARAKKALNEVMGSKKYNPQVRKYAGDLFYELDELSGESPVVIQERIQDLNNSLGGFYEGRVSKAKAQVDASAAKILREDLDNLIEQNTGESYQALKNQYSSLKTIEDDLTKQVALEARKNAKGLVDITDIFTGADLFVGAVTQNPGMLAKGLAGRGFKELFKYINNPNRYIKDAFQVLEKQSKVPVGSSVATRLNKNVGEKVGLSLKDVSDEGLVQRDAIINLLKKNKDKITQGVSRGQINPDEYVLVQDFLKLAEKGKDVPTQQRDLMEILKKIGVDISDEMGVKKPGIK